MERKFGHIVFESLAGLVVVGTGVLEDWYGRFDYAGDAISYLEIARLIRSADWHLVLSPYWSPGYPFLLAGAETPFPSTPVGEWTAVHVVDLLLFVATYLSFLFMLQTAVDYAIAIQLLKEKSTTTLAPNRVAIFVIGTSIFLLFQMLVGDVSRVSPDLLVGGIFYFITALTLRFFLNPCGKAAAVLGLVMGLSYLLKAIFLPNLIVFFGVALLLALQRPISEHRAVFTRLALALPVMAVVTLPYIIALSASVGHFTLGETGRLNYAWNVNHLPHWFNWAPGPGPNGQPIHPALVMDKPPVFAFPEPYHVTYPPWFNPYYEYEGYQSYFNLANQLHALEYNLNIFYRLLLHWPTLHFAILLAITLLFFVREKRTWLLRLRALWPVYIPSLAAIGIYLLVFIEGRYIAGFLCVLVTILFVPLFAATQLLSRPIARGLIIIVALGSLLLIVQGARPTERHILRHETLADDEEWRIGLYFSQAGIQPGDKVAIARDGNYIRNTWAYVGGVRIVAEMGNDAYDPQNQEADLQLFASDASTQQAVLDAFRKAGAVAVVVMDLKKPPIGAGWIFIPGTSAWMERL